MINISNTSIQAFMRCAFKFKMQYVDKIRLDIDSKPMQIGRAIDDYLAGKKISLNDYDDEVKGKVRGMIHAIKELGIGFNKDYEPQKKLEVFFKNQEIKYIGFADFYNKKIKQLVELKTTSKPAYYLEDWNIHDQIATYLACLKECRTVRIATIRVPNMKMTKKYASCDLYTKAIKKEILLRPKYYFNGIKNNGTWGQINKAEKYNKTGMKNKILYVKNCIEYCLDKNYFPKDKGACGTGWHSFKCEYESICKTKNE